MASNIKYQWFLKKYAKFFHEEELRKFADDQEMEALDTSCKGSWKLFSGENNDLVLSYLESDHFLLTKKDVILESFFLPCSKTWIKGVTKADSLLISYQLQDGDARQFRVQFDDQGDSDGFAMRKQCTDILQRYFKICDNENDIVQENEVAEIDELILNKMNSRKGYMVSIPKRNIKELITLCLTDNSFPSFVAEVEQTLKEIGKY